MKYIFYVYKIITEEDPIKIFITSSSEKDTKNLPNYPNFNKWASKLNKTLLNKRLIKGYPVTNEDEEETKTRYWINKYKKYGYNVTSYLKEKEIEKYKLYVCLEGVSITEVGNMFGDRIISISKEDNFVKKVVKYEKKKHENKISTNNSTLKRENKVSTGNYMDELKNVLQRRNSDTNIKIEDLVKKKKKPTKLPLGKKGIYDNFLDELKSKIKVYE